MSIPWGLGKALDVVSAPGVDLPATLSGLYPIVAGVFVLGAAANAGRVFLIQFAGSRIVARLRSTFYADLLSRPLAYHDKERTGELVSRLSTDVAIMSRTVTQNVSDGLRSTVTSVAGTVLLFTISPKLCLIMISVLPPLAIAARLYGRFVRSLSKRTQEALAHAVEEAEEKLSSLRTVRLFGREKTEEGRFNARIGQVLRLAKTESLASATFFGMAGMSGNFTVLAVLYFGSSMVHSGAITVGELTSFLLYTAYVGGSLVGIGGVYTDLMRGLGASTRVFGILDSREPPPIGSLPIPGGQSAALTSTTSIDGLRPSLGGRISFRNVVFTYPTRSGHVFSNLSFDCAPGTVTGIAGPSGSGKSTILSLLLRLYDPEAGSIEVDGYDLRVLDPTWFRSDVAAVVSQEPTLWAGSIEENIRYGRPDATQEEVREAAAAANCLEFIEGFPDRWETKLGERGVDLSGGQRQRIAIARAILKNPKILVLDEASSNLDPVSERLVQVALERVMRGRTVLVIAHRLSTIRNADQILLVRDGGVAERGTYDELIARGGAFASLAAGQEAARRAVEM
ncbi:P-loop containing nucleoside triphosphate hydrolase protein [Hyaloraphidium curvatum]|nr:P-loop containing nucleoside triphosphate hydrolase protein [Hyaloraphidium curvatum]